MSPGQAIPKGMSQPLPRKVCKKCSREVPVCRDGTFREHKAKPHHQRNCSGSGHLAVTPAQAARDRRRNVAPRSSAAPRGTAGRARSIQHEVLTAIEESGLLDDDEPVEQLDPTGSRLGRAAFMLDDDDDEPFFEPARAPVPRGTVDADRRAPQAARLRSLLGLSQADFARLLYISKRTVVRLEKPGGVETTGPVLLLLEVLDAAVGKRPVSWQCELVLPSGQKVYPRRWLEHDPVIVWAELFAMASKERQKRAGG